MPRVLRPPHTTERNFPAWWFRIVCALPLLLPVVALLALAVWLSVWLWGVR